MECQQEEQKKTHLCRGGPLIGVPLVLLWSGRWRNSCGLAITLKSIVRSYLKTPTVKQFSLFFKLQDFSHNKLLESLFTTEFAAPYSYERGYIRMAISEVPVLGNFKNSSATSLHDTSRTEACDSQMRWKYYFQGRVPQYYPPHGFSSTATARTPSTDAKQ